MKRIVDKRLRLLSRLTTWRVRGMVLRRRRRWLVQRWTSCSQRRLWRTLSSVIRRSRRETGNYLSNWQKHLKRRCLLWSADKLNLPDSGRKPSILANQSLIRDLASPLWSLISITVTIRLGRQGRARASLRMIRWGIALKSRQLFPCFTISSWKRSSRGSFETPTWLVRMRVSHLTSLLRDWPVQSWIRRWWWRQTSCKQALICNQSIIALETTIILGATTGMMRRRWRTLSICLKPRLLKLHRPSSQRK